MSRKKTYTVNGEKIPERKMPMAGLVALEVATRPKEQKTASKIDERAVERNLIAP